MRACTHWRRFTKTIHGIVPGQAMPFGPEVVDGRNMNKARRIIKREEQRSLRRMDKPSVAQQAGGVISAEQFANLVDYNEAAFQESLSVSGSVMTGRLPVPSDEEILAIQIQSLKESGMHGFTRDEIRKAFSAASVKGYRNARRDELVDGFRIGNAFNLPDVTEKQQEAIARYLFNILETRA